MKCKQVSPKDIIDTVNVRYRTAIYLTVRQVTKLLCVHRNTVYRMIEEGVFDDYGGVHRIVVGQNVDKIVVPKQTLMNYLKENIREY